MTRIVVGPVCHGDLIDLKRADGLTFRKQILPATPIVYRGRRIKNDEQYRRDLAQAFNEKAMGEATHFLIEDANGHDAGPEQIRGEVIGVDDAQPGEPPGLYATITFPDEVAATAVRSSGNKLGVSPRIFESLTRGDGKFVKAAIGSVLGTLTPVNVGMSPWKPVDLSAYTDAEVWDFSVVDTDETEEIEMARGRTRRRTTDLSSGGADTLEREQLEELTDEQLEALVADAVAELGDEDEDEDPDEVDEAPAGGDADPDDQTPEGEVADLSQLDLAQEARIAALEQQTNDALGQLAVANWERERRTDFAQVPSAVLDLCNTVMTQPEAQVIDLANGDEFDPAAFVRQVLTMVRGYNLVDLAQEQGHGGDPDVTDAEAADNKMIDALEAKFGY